MRHLSSTDGGLYMDALREHGAWRGWLKVVLTVTDGAPAL
jgi:hypothetical protein